MAKKKRKISKREYITIKIANCDQLIGMATSEEQRKIYTSYREHWIGQLSKKDNPDIKAAKELEKERLAAEAFEKARIEAEEKEVEVKAEADREAKQAAILKQIEDLKKLIPEVEEEISETLEILETIVEEEEDEPEPESEDSDNT